MAYETWSEGARTVDKQHGTQIWDPVLKKYRDATKAELVNMRKEEEVERADRLRQKKDKGRVDDVSGLNPSKVTDVINQSKELQKKKIIQKLGGSEPQSNFPGGPQMMPDMGDTPTVPNMPSNIISEDQLNKSVAKKSIEKAKAQEYDYEETMEQKVARLNAEEKERVAAEKKSTKYMNVAKQLGAGFAAAQKAKLDEIDFQNRQSRDAVKQAINYNQRGTKLRHDSFGTLAGAMQGFFK